MNNQLTLNHLSVRAGDHQPIEDVSLTLHRGRVLALVGSSGSGKSMTCSTALDVLPPGVEQTGGNVAVNGVVIPGRELRGRHIATIMQNPRSAFNPLHSMRTHARETCQAAGKEASEARFSEALIAVGLDEPEEILNLYPFEMSGGMLQRVMIALALLSDAPWLFADEPTTDLDMPGQAKILDLLEEVVLRHQTGMLLVTHDMGVVARLADEVAVMSAGKIIEQGSVDAIFYRPRHPVTRQLVAAHLSLYGLELTS